MTSVVLFNLKDEFSMLRQPLCTVRESLHVAVPIQDGLFAAVEVVKFLLGHRVVDVHGRNAQPAGLRQLVQAETQR